MPRTLPRKRIKPPLMVVPTVRRRKTYKHHAPPKVNDTNIELFLPAKNIPILSLTLTLSSEACR